MGCLYFAQLDEVHPIRGGRVASSMFGNKSVPPVTDISIYTDNLHDTASCSMGSRRASGVWYARVSVVYGVIAVT